MRPKVKRVDASSIVQKIAETGCREEWPAKSLSAAKIGLPHRWTSFVQAVDQDDLLARQATANGLVGASTALFVAAGVQVALGTWLDRRR